jgi:outer membrane protein assembly factor BamB
MPRYSATLLLFIASSTVTQAEALWPEFRGPQAQGHSTAVGLPTKWSPSSGIVWRSEFPGLAWSSPVVANGKIFLTDAVTAGAAVNLSVMALAADTGKQLWSTELFAPADPGALKMHKKNSHASPSPVWEDGLIYAHFSHHGTACMKEDGSVVWKSTENPYTPVHGTGGSPVLVGDLLVFNADGSTDPSVIALDKKTGKTVWKVKRESPAQRKFSFSTPLVIEVAGEKQIITAGSGIVQALRPADGSVIWFATYDQGYSVVPRPLFAHGMIFLSTGYDKPVALAIKADGKGDVTATHIVWQADKRVPHNPSMLVIGDDLYMIDDKGMISCRNAKNGEVYYEERALGPCSASLLYGDGRIYAIDELGKSAVVKPGHTLEILFTNDLAEKTLASMSVVDDDLLIRTEKALYRVGK